MQISLQGYNKPTPRPIKKAADTVLAITSILGGSAIVMHDPFIGAIVAIAGAIAKLVSTFVSDSTPTNPIGG